MAVRREKFVDLAEKRVTKTIKDLRLIGNLANKTNYSYTDKDVRKIIGVLRKELTLLHRRFESPGQNNGFRFKLED